MTTLLVVATIAFLSQFADASMLDGPVEVPDGPVPFDFEATLRKVYDCDGTSYESHWENCSYSRNSPDTVLVSMDMVFAEEIPNTRNFLVEILIENQHNGEERTPVAAVTWGDICKEINNEYNEAVQKVLRKVEGGLKCPIRKGVYRAVGVEIDVEDMKPLLREGLMFFSVTQVVESKRVACHVIEFEVSFE